MERRRQSFLRRILPRLWRHHSDYSPSRQYGRLARNTGLASRSDSSILARSLFRNNPLYQAQMNVMQPKCLPQVSYEDILYGHVENFSSDCWLENHLHQFGSLRRRRQQASQNQRQREHRYLFDTVELNIEPQDEVHDDMDDDDASSSTSSIASDGLAETVPHWHQVTVESVPSFVSQVVDSTRRVEMGLSLEEQPPPYYEDPPPTYEEATKERNQSGTRFYLSDGEDCLY